jgi:V8-like Glu-specific endopeptidase
MQGKAFAARGVVAGVLAWSMGVGSVAANGSGPEPTGDVPVEPTFVEWVADQPDGGAARIANLALVPDEAIAPPAHPPMGMVVPRPMPEPRTGPSPAPAVGDEMLVTYDATTGLRREIPVGRLHYGMPFESPVDGDPDPGIGGSGDPAGGGSSFGRLFATSFTDLGRYPARANVKLILRFGARYYSCSGVLVSQGVVVTAAHCIYEQDTDDFADEAWIYPGWDGQGTTSSNYAHHERWGYAYAKSFLVSTRYSREDNDEYDAGIITINPSRDHPGSRNIGALTGWYGWTSTNCSSGRFYSSYAYPAEDCGVGNLHTGEQMYEWSGTNNSCQSNSIIFNTTPGCFTATWGGMSGSGISFSDDRVHGVLSRGSSTRSLYTRIWPTFSGWISDEVDEVRGNTLDLEPMQVRVTGTPSASAGGQFGEVTFRVVNATENNPSSRTVTADFFLSRNNNISDADTYLGAVSYSINFDANDNRLVRVPGLRVPRSLTPGQYYLGVILRGVPGETNRNNNDTDHWDADFVTIGPYIDPGPTAPRLRRPADNSTGIGLRPNLVWGPSRNFRHYNIYLGTDPTPDLGEFRGRTTQRVWRTPRLERGTRYYWRIDAVGTGALARSEVFTFRTVGSPASADDVSPDAAHLALTGCDADFAAPFGRLTFADIGVFVDAYTRADLAADLAAPWGEITLADLTAFVGAFGRACPGFEDDGVIE